MTRTRACSGATSADELPNLAAEQVAYVAGFLLDEHDNVLLIRKKRPAWQAGLLNGIGGKVEPGETPFDAMRREFREEAQLDDLDWDHVLTLTFPAGAVWFFRCFGPTAQLHAARAGTDEPLEVHHIADLLSPDAPTIANLRWILPLAAHTHDTYATPTVSEVAAAPTAGS